MPQDYPGEYVGQYVGESLGQYFGEDPVHAQNIAPDAPPLTPHEIVPMLIGSTVEAIERELVLQTLERHQGSMYPRTARAFSSEACPRT